MSLLIVSGFLEASVHIQDFFFCLMQSECVCTLHVAGFIEASPGEIMHAPLRISPLHGNFYRLTSGARTSGTTLRTSRPRRAQSAQPSLRTTPSSILLECPVAALNYCLGAMYVFTFLDFLNGFHTSSDFQNVFQDFRSVSNMFHLA